MSRLTLGSVGLCLAHALEPRQLTGARIGATSDQIALGFTVGPVVTVGLLVLVAVIIAAFSGEEAGSGREVERRPPIGNQSERTSLVTQALLRRRTKFGPAIWVRCEKSGNGYCAVTYDAPACQWWVVENVNGVDRARPFDKPSEGGHGTYDEESDSIGCSWEIP